MSTGIRIAAARRVAGTLAATVFALLAVASLLLAGTANAVQDGALTSFPQASCVGEEAGAGATCSTRVGTGLGAAYQVVVSPDGKNAYSVAIDGALEEYSRSPLTGALTVIGCLTGLSSPVSECAPEHESSGETVIDSLAAIALSRNGENAYVLDQDKNMVVELSRDAETGLLSVMKGPEGNPECISEGAVGGCETTTAKGLGNPYGIVVSPDEKNVYVTSLGSQAVAEFTRDTSTGTLQQIAGHECVGDAGSGCPDEAKGLANAVGVVVSPDGSNVYVASGAKAEQSDVAAFKREEGTGVLEQLSGEEGCIGDGVSGCAVGTAFNGTEDLVVSPDGSNIYANSFNESAIVELSRDTSGPKLGALAQLASPNACVSTGTIVGCTKVETQLANPLGVAVSPDGQNVYASSSGDAAEVSFERGAEGALVPLKAEDLCVTSGTGCAAGFNELPGLEGARRVTVSPDGENVYVAGQQGNSIAELRRVLRPRVLELTPPDGVEWGGTEVEVTGTEFTPSSTVEFGSTPATNVTYNSPTSITATSPGGTGTVDVTVSNEQGESEAVGADRFSYGPGGIPNLTGYCKSLGDREAALLKGIEGPEWAYNNWVCVTNTAATVYIANLGSSPSMAGACKFEYPSETTFAYPDEENSAYSWSCHLTANPARERERSGPGSSSSTTSKSQTANTASSGGGSNAAPVGPPTLAVDGNVSLVSGTVLVRLPRTRTFVALSGLRQIPFGTVVNATRGRVKVTTAGPRGSMQTGEFFQGEFILSQSRNGLVAATLTGGDFSVCPTARERAHRASATAARASGRHVVRKLWANAHGSFSTNGNYAAGAVQGTEWLTEDLCEGTLIKVTRDKVKVTDLVRHRSKMIKAGHSYLAKAP